MKLSLCLISYLHCVPSTFLLISFHVFPFLITPPTTSPCLSTMKLVNYFRLINEAQNQPSTSSCGSLAFIIPKKEKNECIHVTNYHSLNKITIKKSVPFVMYQGSLVFDQCKGSLYLTKNNLTFKYDHAWINSCDAFKTPSKPNLICMNGL